MVSGVRQRHLLVHWWTGSCLWKENSSVPQSTWWCVLNNISLYSVTYVHLTFRIKSVSWSKSDKFCTFVLTFRLFVYVNIFCFSIYCLFKFMYIFSDSFSCNVANISSCSYKWISPSWDKNVNPNLNLLLYHSLCDVAVPVDWDGILIKHTVCF